MRIAPSANPWEAFLRKVYLTQVVCTVDGDTLKVFNFNQIKMGAGARPILAIWTIWSGGPREVLSMNVY